MEETDNREKGRNRKKKGGFTLVELIVVIVIILVLAAVLVPTVLKYIEKANEAQCKADAATILVQFQADVADMYASGRTINEPGNELTEPGGKDYKVGGVPVWSGLVSAGSIGEDTVVFSMSLDNEVESFGYNNGKYTAIWHMKEASDSQGGWTITKNK